MKREHKLSPHAQELFNSGRGEQLLKQFFIKFYILSQPKPIPKSIPFIYREDWRTHENTEQNGLLPNHDLR